MKAKKRLGQNFLHDPNIIGKILHVANPGKSDTFYEIGSGHGAITDELVKRAGTVHLVELDDELIPELEEKYGQHAHVTIHHLDALTLQLPASMDGRKVRVIGNLPYNVSTPLLIHLLQQADRIEDMLFMLQKEVVTRMAAQPGGKDYGRLSVMLQHRFDVHPLFVVKPGSFVPAPRVDSQMVRLVPKAHPPLVDFSTLERVVKQAFSQRRKTLKNNLKGLFSTRQLEDMGLDPRQRPETVSVDQYCQLARALEANPSTGSMTVI